VWAMFATTCVHAVDGMKAQELANLAWAWERQHGEKQEQHVAGEAGARFTRAILRAAARRLDQFTPQGLGMLAMAFAYLPERVDSCDLAELADGIHALILRLHQTQSTASIRSVDIAGMVWAMSMVRIRDERLLGQIAEVAAASLHKFEARHLSMTAIGFARLTFPAPAFFAALVRLPASIVREWSEQQLGNIMWATACVDVRHRPFLEVCRERAVHLLQQVPCPLLDRHKRMLMQWHLWLELEFTPEERRGLILPSGTREMLRASAAGTDVEDMSAFQRQVETAVVALDLGTPLVASEFSTVDLHPIDIALPEYKIAIEADGPHHFNREVGWHRSDVSWTLDGATVLRDRFLSREGWIVVSVPHLDFRRCRGQDERSLYMRRVLAEPLAIQRQSADTP
jgi:very-short-patch-repair endonuclease